MSDDKPIPLEVYIMAFDVVSHTAENMAIQFQMEGATWPREIMQKHVNDRAALHRTGQLLLDAGERAAGISKA